MHFEGAPHRGDLVTNLALGATLLWLPLTAAAVGRGAFVKYRITDKRISVITSAPWKKVINAPAVTHHYVISSCNLVCCLMQC